MKIIHRLIPKVYILEKKHHMIDRIIYDKKQYENYTVNHGDKSFPDNALLKLSKLNIFIGENNSGKSRFLRTLFTDKNFERKTANFDIAKIKGTIDKGFKTLFTGFKQRGIEDTNNLGKMFTDLRSIPVVDRSNINDYIEKIKNTIEVLIILLS